MAPPVPPPHDCADFRTPPADSDFEPPPWVDLPFWNHVERRIAAGHGWWVTPRPAGRSEGAIWLRLDETPRLDDNSVEPLVHVMLSDLLANAVSDALGAEDFAFISIDHTVHLVGSTTDEWCLVAYRAEDLADGYVSLRGEMWDEHGRLLVTMSQLGLVRDLAH